MNDEFPIDCAVDIGTQLKWNTTRCCYASNFSSRACNTTLSYTSRLKSACPSGNCINDCANTTFLYSSSTQDNLVYDQDIAVARYGGCLTIPGLAKIPGSVRDTFPTASRSIIDTYIPRTATKAELVNVTSAVTDCLSSTCRTSRGKESCYDQYCSPVKLLRENDRVDLEGMNSCLLKLCFAGFDALPFADADIIGIGVYSSYLLQCAFVLVLALGVVVSFLFRKRSRKENLKHEKDSKKDKSEDNRNHVEHWQDLLTDFHKTQCFFIGTLMVAAFAQHIYAIDTLTTFLLTPIAMNGILPVTFTYLLLVTLHKCTLWLAILTSAVYTLSSVIFWSLFLKTINIADLSNPELSFYQQFMTKLTANDACGGYSALAVCPDNGLQGLARFRKALHGIKTLPPIIWSISTIVLIFAFTRQFTRKRSRQLSLKQEARESKFAGVWKYGTWASSGLLVMTMGMQLSLLSISNTLEMMGPQEWSFGQIVGVTIWFPPLVEYITSEIKDLNRRQRDKRLAKYIVVAGKEQDVDDDMELQQVGTTPIKSTRHDDDDDIPLKSSAADMGVGEFTVNTSSTPASRNDDA